MSTAAAAIGPFEQDLRDFGMTWEELSTGVLLRAQNIARAYENGLYPPTGPGLVRWLNTVRFLHELLRPRGWEPSPDGRLQGKLIHRDLGRALVVMSGDLFTGIADQMPRSRYPTGAQTQVAVTRNGSVQLPFSIFTEAEASAPVTSFETWSLLSCVTPKVIQTELSRAVGLDETGRVARFEPRILLPLLPNDGTAPEILPQDDDDWGNGDIDVPVQPR